MLSLAYSLISLAFQINFSGGNPVSSHTEVTSTVDGNSNPTAFGHGTFPVYWMLNCKSTVAINSGDAVVLTTRTSFRHDSVGPRLREHDDVRRPTLDCTVAHLLGHY